MGLQERAYGATLMIVSFQCLFWIYDRFVTFERTKFNLLVFGFISIANTDKLTPFRGLYTMCMSDVCIVLYLRSPD